MSSNAPTYDSSSRMRVLDAAAELQHLRSDAARRLTAGAQVSGAEILASGSNLAGVTMTLARSWRELLSTRPRGSAKALSRTMPWNRELQEQFSLRMVSVFDYESTEPDARYLLEQDTDVAYLYGYAPVQMNIVDRRQVLVEGPSENTGPSILSLSSAPALECAWAYWHAVMATTQPCRRVAVPELSERQIHIFDLLALGLGDDRVGALLKVSARTVRADVADAMRALGVDSRFAAGYAYQALSRLKR